MWVYLIKTCHLFYQHFKNLIQRFMIFRIFHTNLKDQLGLIQYCQFTDSFNGHGNNNQNSHRNDILPSVISVILWRMFLTIKEKYKINDYDLK